MERCTVSSDKWIHRLDAAAATYTMAVYWTNTGPQPREDAARMFQSLVTEFEIGGPAALDVLIAGLRASDVIQRNSAARILVELPSRDAAEALLDDLLKHHKGPSLESSVLRRLNTQLFFSGELWRILSELNLPEQIALLDSLLRDSTDAGLQFAEQKISDDPSSELMQVVVKSLAKWGRRDLLWKIMKRTSAILRPEYPDWLQADARLDAALYLGLLGELDAVDFLVEIGQASDSSLAAQAALCLAWLAVPRAVSVINSLLLSEDVHAAGVALNAASALACAALGPALLTLISESRPLLSPTSVDTASLPIEAIRVLEEIIDLRSSADTVEASIDLAPDTVSMSRLEVIPYMRELLQGLNSACRYQHGKPLTLTHLADRLVSPHDGPRRAAAYNLRAITGEDHGFDPDLDLIANLPAIAAWRDRARKPSSLVPGGWAFAGQSIPGPVLR